MKKVLLLAVIVILNCTSAHTQTITNTTWSVYNTASDLVYLYHFGTDTGYMSTDFINYNAISIFTDNGHDMVITDIPGAPMACATTDSGYFTYVILNDTVNFQVVSDPCTVRQLNLTQYHWVISTTNIEDLSKPPVICLFPNPSKDGIYHLSIMNNNFDLISIYYKMRYQRSACCNIQLFCGLFG